MTACLTIATIDHSFDRYLAEVTKMSSGAQTALLYIFMGFGVWGLTIFNLRVQRMPQEKKDDVKVDFTLEVTAVGGRSPAPTVYSPPRHAPMHPCPCPVPMTTPLFPL